jgi:hypothetical protein
MDETTQKPAAEHKRTLANQLMTQAQVIRTQRPDLLPLGVLLAIESLRQRPSEEAEQFLRQVAQRIAAPTALLTPNLEQLTQWVDQTGRATPQDLGWDANIIAFSPSGCYLVVELQASGSFARTKVLQIWDRLAGSVVLQLGW